MKSLNLKSITLIFLLTSGLSQYSFASTNTNSYNYLMDTMKNSPKSSNNSITCWDYAAKKYNVDPWMLFAISAVESTFTPNIKSRNKNGTYDLGLMQINTIHTNTFKKMGISQHELQNDSCKGIIAGAFILRQSINKFGNNIDGIGGYHSYTKSLRRPYAKKVIKKYNELVSHYYINDNHFSFASYKGKRPKTKVHNVYKGNNGSNNNAIVNNNNNLINASGKNNNNYKNDIKFAGVRNFNINPDNSTITTLNSNDNGLMLKKSK